MDVVLVPLRSALRALPASAPVLACLSGLAWAGCRAPDGGGPPEASPASSPEAALAERIFGPAPSGDLDAESRNRIAGALGLVASPDGPGLVDETCGQPAAVAVTYPDRDGDGIREVQIDVGNVCLSGAAGTSVTLFVRDAQGRWTSHLGVPGLIADVRPAAGGGPPDLLVGGPGFCFALWRWQDGAYVFDHDEAQAPGGCDDR